MQRTILFIKFMINQYMIKSINYKETEKYLMVTFLKNYLKIFNEESVK